MSCWTIFKDLEKIDKYRIPKESPTRQNWKCCRLGLIEPVHEDKLNEFELQILLGMTTREVGHFGFAEASAEMDEPT
jgi:hypothetical protein